MSEKKKTYALDVYVLTRFEGNFVCLFRVVVSVVVCVCVCCTELLSRRFFFTKILRTFYANSEKNMTLNFV